MFLKVLLFLQMTVLEQYNKISMFCSISFMRFLHCWNPVFLLLIRSFYDIITLYNTLPAKAFFDYCSSAPVQFCIVWYLWFYIVFFVRRLSMYKPKKIKTKFKITRFTALECWNWWSNYTAIVQVVILFLRMNVKDIRFASSTDLRSQYTIMPTDGETFALCL